MIFCLKHVSPQVSRQSSFTTRAKKHFKIIQSSFQLILLRAGLNGDIKSAHNGWFGSFIISDPAISGTQSALSIDFLWIVPQMLSFRRRTENLPGNYCTYVPVSGPSPVFIIFHFFVCCYKQLKRILCTQEFAPFRPFPASSGMMNCLPFMTISKLNNLLCV